MALAPVTLVFESWFHSQTQARFIVWAQNGALLAGALLRLAFIAAGATVLAFAWAAAFEALLAGGLLAVLYARHGGRIAAWTFDPATARSLLRHAWPLAVINLSALFYSRIDVVMLSALRGEAEAGIYSAAIRLTELGYILPMILVTSLFPTLARLHLADPAAFRARLQQLCTLVTWLGVALAAGLSFGAPLLVRLTYGATFAPAAGVLAISAWAVVFASQGAARGQWLLLENLQRFGLWYVLIGVATNVTLNLVLIPRFGAAGAASASVVTQFVVALVAPAFFAPTRPGVGYLLRAFGFRPAPSSANPDTSQA
jgi:PST family polysaccharide transporter